MGRGKVLVMDDEEMVREVLGGMLSRLGYEADSPAMVLRPSKNFSSAKEANQAFDAVILDLTISRGHGGRRSHTGSP